MTDDAVPASADSLPPPDITRQLLTQAAGGQADAVNALLERHRDNLQRMIRSRLDPMLHRRLDASDVVQDVLLEASQRLPDYLRGPPVPFALWLRQMAQDRIIDLHRRHRVAARRSIDREQPLAAGYSDDSSRQLAAQLQDHHELTPATALLRRELQQRFVDALELLAPDDKDIIVMRHFEQLTNSDVAQLLGLSPSAAGMRHLRALRRLRSLLGEPGADDNSVSPPAT